ncbi:MAG: hypothetical protein QOG77_2456 [Solirubrobacteraceae bacterium]|nr:hypothetical protein [Solirubrobacteraceae bacterium]
MHHSDAGSQYSSFAFQRTSSPQGQNPAVEVSVKPSLPQCGEIEPSVWVIDDTGFAKNGRWSVGVARRYSGTLGRVDNCQIGVSISAAGDEASCPINWRTFLPERSTGGSSCRRSGTQTPSGAPRRMCRPADVGHREKWRLALA